MKKTFAPDDIRLPVAIVGMGISGQSVLRLLLLAGINRDSIWTFDQKDSKADIRDSDQLVKKNPQTLVVSPGVPLSTPWIQDFRLKGGLVTSELTLASLFLTTERRIGVTGSIGKSTVTSLIEAGLHKWNPSSFVGGNLGTPLADYACSLLQGRRAADWVALELSSYQLENYHNLDLDAGVITYLTPNHLERYSSLEEYYESKWFLAERTRGPLILNENGGDLKRFASQKSHSSVVWTSALTSKEPSSFFEGARLIGNHNRDNLAIVAELARQLTWPTPCFEGFQEFPGLPHRLENLGVKNGILFVNDSKATTIESVLQAVRSTQDLTQKKLHLLIGGKDKNLPWEDLAALQSELREFYFFGSVAELAQQKSQLPGTVFHHLKDAILRAKSSAKAGDLVLLSPGGTSLDEFKSFEERGDFFKSQI